MEVVNVTRVLYLVVLSLIIAGCSAPDDAALFQAIQLRDAKLVERILAKGNVNLDPPRQSNQVNKPLAFAVAYGDLEIVKLILESGADINGQVAYGDVPLIKAVEHDNRDILVYLIEQGADVNRPNAFGMSPFIGFCAAGDIELVALAVKHGGMINEAYVVQTEQGRGETNCTALQIAASYGKTDVVRLLLENGGDPRIKDQSGKDCLDLAIEGKHEEIVRMLESDF